MKFCFSVLLCLTVFVSLAKLEDIPAEIADVSDNDSQLPGNELGRDRDGRLICLIPFLRQALCTGTCTLAGYNAGSCRVGVCVCTSTTSTTSPSTANGGTTVTTTTTDGTPTTTNGTAAGGLF